MKRYNWDHNEHERGDWVKYSDHLVELDKLKSWVGLLSMLNEYYPSDLFNEKTSLADKTATMVIVLTRELSHLKSTQAEQRRIIRRLQFDMESIDNLCEIAHVHKFTAMRTDLEDLLSRLNEGGR